MEPDDEELIEVLDQGVVRQIANVPYVTTNFRNTFGTASTALTQQWVNYGMAQHNQVVHTTVQQSVPHHQNAYTTQSDQDFEMGSEDAKLSVRDLPSGTRVLLVNDEDSFYGAVGTVRRVVDNTSVSVEFDLKQGKPYTVPVAHLEIYQGNSHATETLKDGNDLWIFNGVPSVVRFMQAKQSECGKWAFIGSVALAYWAAHYSVAFRSPHDIDIVVSDVNAWYREFRAAIGAVPRAPSLNADHKTVELNLGHVDLIADGQGLGEFGSGPHTIGGVPVVGLQTIGSYKKKRNQDKDREDLKVVDQLLRLQGGN